MTNDGKLGPFDDNPFGFMDGSGDMPYATLVEPP